MVDVARSAISGVDLLMLVVEATSSADPAFIQDVLVKVKIPVVLVINKIDLLSDKNQVLKKIADWACASSVQGNCAESAVAMRSRSPGVGSAAATSLKGRRCSRMIS